jgi:2-iminobutanoate/2-iminopropanoate deaminase
MKKKLYPARYPVKVRFSRSAIVNNYIFASGCSGQTLETFHVSSNDVEEQTEVALDKIKAALEEAGSTIQDIFKIIVYLTDIEDYPKVEKKLLDYFLRHAPKLIEEPPVNTVVAIPALHESDLLIEIEAFAVLKK